MSRLARGVRRARTVVALGLLGTIAATSAIAARAEGANPPSPETDLLLPLDPEPCEYEGNDPYERRLYRLEGWNGLELERYPGACERLRFAYSRVSSSGVPTVPLGSELRFTNVEGAAIYHSITTCRFPCLGATGAAFPIADGRTSGGRRIDLDSGSLGIGIPSASPAKQTLAWDLPVTKERGFKAGETVTYFCRIHPFMRGAFQVTE